MAEKAIGNDFQKREWAWGILMILAILAALALGFWLGGWRESILLRSGLEQIPDINRCY